MRPQARRLLGLHLRFEAQALGFRARALRIAAARFHQQFAALAIQCVDLPARGLDAGRLLRDRDPALGQLACSGHFAPGRGLHRGDRLPRLQALVLRERRKPGIDVELLQARGQSVRLDRPRERVRRHPVRSHLQAGPQTGQFGQALAAVGVRAGGGAAHARKVRVGGRGQRRCTGLILAATRHGGLRLLQPLPRTGNVRRGVLVGIGILRTRHGLLRGIEFRGRRRQAGATCKCEGHRKAAGECVPGRTEVCEAWAHWGPCVVIQGRGHCGKPATPSQIVGHDQGIT